MTHVDLPNQSKGGVAAQAHYLSNALVARGHEVTMFTYSPAYAECQYQVHQYRVPSHPKPLHPFSFGAYLAQTDLSAYDVLHTHGDNFLLHSKHPQVRTFHGSALDEAQSAVKLRRRLYQLVIAGVEHVSTSVADVNVGVSRTTQHRIPAVSRVIPCGVDLSRFRPGAKSSSPSVLFVGTTGGRKRGSFLAEVFLQEVRSRFPNAELWTVTDQPIPGEGITNFGRVSLERLCELYQQAWVFCLPSTYEGFGIPYIEAMASGTSVVTTPNPGADEILEHDRHGVMATDETLGEQINRLLADEPLRAMYAVKGLARSQQYSWDCVTQQYEELYQQIIDDYTKTDRGHQYSTPILRKV